MMRMIQEKSQRMLEVEQEHGEMIEELLRRLYVDEDLDVRMMSQYLNISYVTCIKWMRLTNITSKRIDIGDST